MDNTTETLIFTFKNNYFNGESEKQKATHEQLGQPSMK